MSEAFTNSFIIHTVDAGRNAAGSATGIIQASWWATGSQTLYPQNPPALTQALTHWE